MSIAESRTVVKAELEHVLSADWLRGMDSVPCVDAGMVFERAGDGDGDGCGFSGAMLRLGPEATGEKQERCQKIESSGPHVEALGRGRCRIAASIVEGIGGWVEYCFDLSSFLRHNSWEVDMVEGNKLNARLIGVELYFDDLQRGKRFYDETLGLELLDEEAGHHARFNAGQTFVCLERKGSESYPSRDKAVIFLEVPNLADAVRCIGEERILEMKPQGEGRRRSWAVLHDPEGHNIVLLEASPSTPVGQNPN